MSGDEVNINLATAIGGAVAARRVENTATIREAARIWDVLKKTPQTVSTELFQRLLNERFAQGVERLAERQVGNDSRVEMPDDRILQTILAKCLADMQQELVRSTADQLNAVRTATRTFL